MKKMFKNSGNLTCIFTDEGVSLYGKKNEAYYPYGCMKGIFMWFFGTMEIRLRDGEATFFTERADRPAMRKAIKDARARIRTAEPEEAKIYLKCSKVPDTLPKEEQLKQYLSLVSTGTISKGYYDLKKRLLKD